MYSIQKHTKTRELKSFRLEMKNIKKLFDKEYKNGNIKALEAINNRLFGVGYYWEDLDEEDEEL